MRRLMDKRANAIPIAIFTIATIALSFFTIGYFLIKQGDIEEVFDASSEIDKLYKNEILLDFYLQNVFDESVDGFDRNNVNGPKRFVEKFREELRKYLVDGRYPIDELANVDLRLLEENVVGNVEIDDDFLKFRLDVKISRYGSADRLVLEYDYVREFEKVFK